jgi:hypothetical protein
MYPLAVFVWHFPWDQGWSWTWFWSVSGRWYALWSGFGGCLGMLSAALVLTWHSYRKHTCHMERCWRYAHHALDAHGTTYRVCHRHHPTAQRHLTLDDVSA